MLSLLGFVGLGSFLRGRAVRPRQFFSEALVRCRVCLLRTPRMSLPAETKAAFCSELLVARPSPSAPATSSEPSRPLRTPQDGVCFVLVSLDTLALRGASKDKARTACLAN